jgi:Domain of unknown function (DUF4365)
MQHRKRRDRRHLMEEESGNLLRTALPAEWVIHEYKPDYGIDGIIEIFDPVAGEDNTFETLGEQVFFQLKSVDRTSLGRRVARSYTSILKGGEEDGRRSSIDYEAFIYDLEVDELLTVEAMGAAFVVVLFVVALDTRTTYMISLTDYIERVLDRDDPDWRTKTRKRIYIPSSLTMPSDSSTALLRLYGGRSKLMHLFNVVTYQYNELSSAYDKAVAIYELGGTEYRGMRELAARFCERLLALDIWENNAWPITALHAEKLRACRRILSGDLTALAKLGIGVSVEQIREMGFSEEEFIDGQILSVWQGLRSMGAGYEEITREVGLPTYLGITSQRR